MSPPRSAALISDRDFQFIDHLAPLAALLSIPVIVSDEEVQKLVEEYYPQGEVVYKDPVELALYVVEEFEIIYTSLPTLLFRELCFGAELLLQKEIFNVWCPHGNSDKGHGSKHMEFLSKERFALVYGQKLTDFLLDKGSFEQLEGVGIIGNYRLQFYKQHQSFYEEKVQAALGSKRGTTVLYAPTWDDGERSSSFASAHRAIAEKLPDHFHLLIKPHPHFFAEPQIAELLIAPFRAKKNVQILQKFPPIYPLLDFVDIYLGDMSSIGYDFLSFKKPMFFLNPNKRDPTTDRGLYLTQCGVLIEPERYGEIFSIIEQGGTEKLKKRQETVYREVFGEEENFAQKIVQVYEQSLQRS